MPSISAHPTGQPNRLVFLYPAIRAALLAIFPLFFGLALIIPQYFSTKRNK